jgi:anti-sigma B factor antagonist
MPEASFLVETIGAVPVVAAPEEIDITNAAGLRAAAQGDGTLVVDMSRTQFCDSAGLNVLVRAHNRAQAQGREVLLVISGAAVLRMFAVTGIDHLIPSFASLEEALAHAVTVSGSPPLAAAVPPCPCYPPPPSRWRPRDAQHPRVLLGEDDPGDVLTTEAFAQHHQGAQLHVAGDGEDGDWPARGHDVGPGPGKGR